MRSRTHSRYAALPPSTEHDEELRKLVRVDLSQQGFYLGQPGARRLQQHLSFGLVVQFSVPPVDRAHLGQDVHAGSEIAFEKRERERVRIAAGRPRDQDDDDVGGIGA